MGPEVLGQATRVAEILGVERRGISALHSRQTRLRGARVEEGSVV